MRASGSIPNGCPIVCNTSSSETSCPRSKSASRNARLTTSPVRSSTAYTAAARPNAGIDVPGNVTASKPANKSGATCPRNASISWATTSGSSGAPLSHSSGHARTRTTGDVSRPRRASLAQSAQPNVRERAHDVGEHLDARHEHTSIAIPTVRPLQSRVIYHSRADTTTGTRRRVSPSLRQPARRRPIDRDLCQIVVRAKRTIRLHRHTTRPTPGD